MVHFHSLVEGDMHNLFIVEPDHDAFLVIQQGINGGNTHFGSIHPVFGTGASTALYMA